MGAKSDVGTLSADTEVVELDFNTFAGLSTLNPGGKTV